MPKKNYSIESLLEKSKSKNIEAEKTSPADYDVLAERKALMQAFKDGQSNLETNSTELSKNNLNNTEKPPVKVVEGLSKKCIQTPSPLIKKPQTANERATLNTVQLMTKYNSIGGNYDSNYRSIDDKTDRKYKSNNNSIDDNYGTNNNSIDVIHGTNDDSYGTNDDNDTKMSSECIHSTNYSSIDDNHGTSDKTNDSNAVQNMVQNMIRIDVQKNTADPKYLASVLSGDQLKAFSFIVSECKKNGLYETDRISITYFILATGLNRNSINQGVKRLKAKQLLKTVDGKPGRGGWVKYQIPAVVFQHVLKHPELFNFNLNDSNYSSHNGSHNSQNDPSSLHAEEFKQKKQTRKPQWSVHDEIPEDWENIKISETLKERGFRGSHIKQLYHSVKEELTYEDIQDSLDDFTYDIENEKVVINTTAVRLFMGIVRKEKIKYRSNTLFLLEKEEINKQKAIREELNFVRNKEKIAKTNIQTDQIISSMSDSDKLRYLKPIEELGGINSKNYLQMLREKVFKDIYDHGKLIYDLEQVSEEQNKFLSEIKELENSI